MTDATGRRVWTEVSGPYLTLALVGVVQLLSQMVTNFPNPGPLLLMAVVYSAFSGGARAGVMSATVTVAFYLAYFSLPGQPFTYTLHGLQEVVFLVLTTAATVVMVGWLQRRAARAFELASANARLKELDELKTQFLNNAAHELRTPLTPIKMQMHVLKATGLEHLDERQVRALTMVERNIDRLNHLVQDLLEVARLQAGRLHMERERLDLHRLCTEALESFHDQASASQVTLELRGQPGVWVVADPKRVIQVLFNLLTNALKFTPAGGAVVVEVAREGATAAVRVRDNGRGIEPPSLDRLFQPFSQVHDPTAVPIPGSGLGLFICRGIVEQHGGAISASSDGPGRGATFAFTLPAAPPLAHGATARAPAP